MPRIDTLARTRDIYQLFKMRDKLQSQLAFHERSIADIKREIDALSIIEKSKYLHDDAEIESQPSLFGKTTVKDRMLEAIGKMPAKFTRKELHEAINNDGKGEVLKVGTFSVFFSRFVSRGVIATIEKPHGHTIGCYAKGTKF
jgi:hypothetical protein